MMDIKSWLKDLGLSKYEKSFEVFEVDMEVLPDLTERDLIEMDIPLGTRKKLIKAIAALNAQALNASSTAPVPALETPHDRRQLTVMFVDLVGSTALSEQFDPEDLSEIIRVFRETCEGAISKYSGNTARFLGDGLLIYFGYPIAHENSPEQAARAGLEVVDALAEVRPFDLRLKVRIGIATGPVVVGEVIGEGSSLEKSVYGETPNLAARLQSLAEPNTVVISDQTKQLTGGTFECVDLGVHTLKGFTEPVRAWQPVRLQSVESRFEAKHGHTGVNQIVGRERELSVLQMGWQQACSSKGQIITLAGEAGIGKSRLIQAVREQVSEQPHASMRFFCTQFNQYSAFFPVIAHIESSAKFERNDNNKTKLNKLVAMLEDIGQDVSVSLPIIASLLTIRTDDHFLKLKLNLTPGVLKEKIMGALLDHFLSVSKDKPLLMLFEDLHWIDPSSLELLERLVNQIPDASILIVATSRPEFTVPWQSNSANIGLTLGRLDTKDIKQLINSMIPGKDLPQPIFDAIIAKSDGTPLFIEELTKTMLSSKFLVDTGERYVLSGVLPAVAVPNTLKDSLAARLNHTVAAKQIAQIGSVIGRVFHYDLLAAISRLTASALQVALDELCTAALIIPHGHPPDSHYSFKHALVQDAAYDSLLRKNCQSIHGEIAALIKERFPDTARSEPELLAHHFTGAKNLSEAIKYWQLAGKNSAGQSAYIESVNHCRQALVLLSDAADTTENLQFELDTRLLMGVGLVATMGYAADEISDNYARAQQICDELEDTPHLIPTLYGLWVFHLLRGNRTESVDLANQLYRYSSDPQQPIVTSSALAINAFWSGDRLDARSKLDEAMSRFSVDKHEGLAQIFGDDADLLPHFYGYWNLWVCGFPDQALTLLKQTNTYIEKLGSPYVVATSMLFNMILMHALRDLSALTDTAEQFRSHASEHGYPFFVSTATAGLGSAEVQNGQHQKGIELIKQGVSGFRLTGARMSVSYYLHLLAEAQLLSGDWSAGLETVDEALQLTDTLLDDLYAPELLRLKGELLRLTGDDTDAALTCFNRSLELARKNNAKMIELRTAMSLCRLQSKNKNSDEYHSALTMLADIYSQFTEGHGTTDLLEAKQMLDEMAAIQ
ncbi:MAG: class 3 adenylate cyclase/predicted ATPase [Granulosicoccus sp.]|jgi:class 3 adenylate cyclase/predicted ATPase